MSKNRKDGSFIKPEDSVHMIMPYLFENRIEAEVYQNVTFDITKLKKWVDSQNKKLDYKMTIFHAFTGIFAKTIYNRPLLNRFVQGHRIYERNYISFAFVAKDKMSDEAEEKLVVIKTNKDENVLDLSRRMAIDIFKTKSTGTNDLDKILKMFMGIPRWLMKIIMKVVKWLDYHGKLPKGLWENDSNYQTVLLSNLGSIKCDSCYHHLNNYGTNSIVLTIGTIREENGKTLVDVGATLDERIADGFYFAKSLKMAQYIMDNPKLLEDKLSEEIELKL